MLQKYIDTHSLAEKKLILSFLVSHFSSAVEAEEEMNSCWASLHFPLPLSTHYIHFRREPFRKYKKARKAKCIHLFLVWSKM